MLIEARVTRIWKLQRLFLAVLLLGFCAAFLFDGFIRYPRLNKQFDTYQQYMEEARRPGISEEERAKAEAEGKAKWEAHAGRENWKPKPPEKRYSEVEQFICAGVTGILGLVALFYWIGQKSRILRIDEEGVLTPGGKKVPFEAIKGIGKKKWESKGLATVRYEYNGQRGEFIVDDYKFDAQPARQILEEIEKRLLARSNPRNSGAGSGQS